MPDISDEIKSVSRIPGRVSASTDFKARRERQLKKEASSSHNWNSLFLGADAVANLMAEKYNVAKSDVSGRAVCRSHVATRC